MVDTSILDGIQGVNEPQLTTEDVYKSPASGLSPAEQDAYSDYINKYNPTMPQLRTQDYYPTIGEPINQGNFSGSWKGGSISAAQYAPSGAIVPIGMFAARDEAIQKAALAKAKDVSDFRKGLKTKAPISKLTGINEDLTNEYFKYIDDSWSKTLKATNNDPNKAKYMLENDVEFQKGLKSFQDLKATGDATFNKIADVQDRIAKNKMIVSPQLNDAMKNVQKALNPKSPEFKNLSQYVLQMDAEREFSDALNETLRGIQMQQDASAGIDINDPDYIKEYESTSKYYTPESIQYATEALKDIYSNSGIYSPEEVDSRVKAAMAAVQKTKKVSAKAGPSGAGGVELIDAKDISKEPVSLLGAVKRTEGAEAREGNFSAYEHLTLKKPVSIVIPGGADVTDMNTGEKSTNKSVRNAKVGTIFNAYTYKGQLVDDEFVKREDIKGLAKVTPMVSVIFTEKDAEGKTFETSGIVPLNQVKNAMLGKKNQNKETIDYYEKSAQEREQSLKKGKASVTETQSKGGGYSINGKNYTLQELKNLGYTEEQVAPYKVK